MRPWTPGSPQLAARTLTSGVGPLAQLLMDNLPPLCQWPKTGQKWPKKRIKNEAADHRRNSGRPWSYWASPVPLGRVLGFFYLVLGTARRPLGVISKTHGFLLASERVGAARVDSDCVFSTPLRVVSRGSRSPRLHNSRAPLPPREASALLFPASLQFSAPYFPKPPLTGSRKKGAAGPQKTIFHDLRR